MLKNQQEIEYFSFLVLTRGFIAKRHSSMRKGGKANEKPQTIRLSLISAILAH